MISMKEKRPVRLELSDLNDSNYMYSAMEASYIDTAEMQIKMWVLLTLTLLEPSD